MFCSMLEQISPDRSRSAENSARAAPVSAAPDRTNRSMLAATSRACCGASEDAKGSRSLTCWKSAGRSKIPSQNCFSAFLAVLEAARTALASGEVPEPQQYAGKVHSAALVAATPSAAAHGAKMVSKQACSAL